MTAAKPLSKRRTTLSCDGSLTPLCSIESQDETLRRLQTKIRKKRADTPSSQGVSVIPPESVSSVSSVAVSQALHKIEQFLRSYVVLPDHSFCVLALWVLHAYLLDAADCTPYLHVTSPVKQSGKTRLLEALHALTPNSWLTGRTTTAALIRRLEKGATLFLDETDQAFTSGADYCATLTGILNSGHRRGLSVTLSIRGDGKKADWEAKDFCVFGAKCIAGIGQLPDTVADRSIRIEMLRRTDEPVKRWRYREAEAEAATICAELKALVMPALLEALRAARPALPESLSDRAQDVWEPLLAIADVAGWGDRARKVAETVSAPALAEDDGDVTVQLLSDVWAIFKCRPGLPWVRTDTIVGELLSPALVERPWQTISKGFPLTPHMLGQMLRGFNIRSCKKREGGSEKRGYDRAPIQRAFAIYSGRNEDTRAFPWRYASQAVDDLS